MLSCGCVERVEVSEVEKTSDLTVQKEVFRTDFKIGNITIGSSTADVLREWGEPSKKVEWVGICNSDEFCEDWVYDNASISFYTQPTVNDISSQANDVCLWNSLCPGDTVEKALAILGPSKVIPSSNTLGSRLEYISKDIEACWLWVFVDEEKLKTVLSLRLVCQP